MIQLINWKEKEKWNEIVSEFKNADTYFKCQYSVSFMENEEGTPYLVYYESNGVKVCYPIIEKLTGIGDYAYHRKDDVCVVPIGCLKN